MTTSGPWPPTPHGSDVFDRLWAACLDCGSLEPTSGCEVCGVPGRPAPGGGGAAGSRLWFRRPGAAGQPPSSLGATVIVNGGRWITTVHDDGKEGVDEDGTEYAWWSAPSREGPAEQLLVAATHWRLPEVAARAVRARARQQIEDEDRPAMLRFAAIAAANGHPELLDGLELRAATLTWFEVLGLARAGDEVAACRRALLLKADTFPARLGLWARAAAQLPDELRASILDRLGEFHGNVEVDAAVAATRHALTGGSTLPPAPSRPLPTTVDELCTALRDEDHDGWFTNLRIGLDAVPDDEAVDRLSRLSAEAATTARRVACGNLALDRIEAADADDGAPPIALREALRALVAGAIDDPSFRRFAAVLAEHDAAWMAGFDQRPDPAQATSVPARFFAARARGLPAAIADASGLLGSWFVDRHHPWLRAELQRLRTDALAALPTDPAVRQAIADHPRLATETALGWHDPAELTMLVELAIAAAGPEPDPSMTELLTRTADLLRQLTAADRARLAPIVSTRLRALASTVLDTSERQLDDLEGAWQALRPQRFPRSPRSPRSARRSHEPAHDEATLALDSAVRELRSPLFRLHPHAPPDLQHAFAATLRRVERLQARLEDHAQLSRQRLASRDQRLARSRPPERP